MRDSLKAPTMNHQPLDPAINFPYRPILLLMLAMGALSLAGAGVSMTSPQPAVTTVATN
jgi:hypothetical protein